MGAWTPNGHMATALDNWGNKSNPPPVTPPVWTLTSENASWGLCKPVKTVIATTDLWPQEMFTFLEMLVSESSFGAYVCHTWCRRPVGLHRHRRVLWWITALLKVRNWEKECGSFFTPTLLSDYNDSFLLSLEIPSNFTVGRWRSYDVRSSATVSGLHMSVVARPDGVQCSPSFRPSHRWILSAAEETAASFSCSGHSCRAVLVGCDRFEMSRYSDGWPLA